MLQIRRPGVEVPRQFYLSNLFLKVNELGESVLNSASVICLMTIFGPKSGSSAMLLVRELDVNNPITDSNLTGTELLSCDRHVPYRGQANQFVTIPGAFRYFMHIAALLICLFVCLFAC